MAKKKILVTGSAGFIGFHLCEYLLKNNWDVAGIDGFTDYYDVDMKKKREKILLNKNNYFSYHGMLENKNFISEVFNSFKPEVIVHLAAQAGVRYSIDNPESYINSNLIGTFNILEVAKDFEIKHLLAASSSSVYGSNKEMPFHENQKCDTPVSFYAATKKANELMFHSYSHLYSIPVTMLRFFTVYGPYGRPDMALFKFTDLIKKNEEIKVYNDGLMKRDFTYISDVITAIYLLLDIIPQKPNQRTESIKNDSISNVAPWRVVNIGSSCTIKLVHFIKLIEDSLGLVAKKKMLPLQLGDILETWSSTHLLKNLTNFQPQMPIEKGILMFVNWYNMYYKK